jgi:MFS family permease
VTAADTAPTRRARFGSLWSHGDFMKFWFGETVSLFGTQVTYLALPLTAVLVLNVNPRQLGVLRFLEVCPFIFLALILGVWVDRRRRRPVMMLANLARGLLIGLIPLLAAVHALRLPVLYLVAFMVGIFTVLFEVSWLSYVPGLVPKEQLIEANGKVAASSASAEVAGPGLGGLLVQLLTAPTALLVDAVSYAVSLASLLLIGTREPAPAPPAGGRRNLRGEIADGVRLVVNQPFLRVTAVQGAVWNFAFMASEPLFLLYAIRQLHFRAGLVGAIYAVGAVGGVIGAAAAGTVSRRATFGAAYTVAVTFGSLAGVLLPAAGGPESVKVVLFVLAFFLIRLGVGLSNVLAITLRQTVTPNHMLGRMNASMRTILWGIGSLGALAGGLLGATLGLRPALWVTAGIYAASLVPVLVSSIPRLATLPEAPETPASQTSAPASV